MQPATQPARYCSPSSKSASVSINGAAATNFSASATAEVRGPENGVSDTTSTLERVPVLSQPRTFMRVARGAHARSLITSRSALISQRDQRLPHIGMPVQEVHQVGA